MTKLARYFRRHGLRWAASWFRFGVVLWACLGFWLVMWIAPSGWALVAVIVAYGVHATTEAIKARKPIIITHTPIQADALSVSGSNFSVEQAALDKAVERLIASEREKS